MKLMWELKDRECHYAIKEDREVAGHFYFCAEPAASDRPYCETHKKLCSTRTEFRPRKMRAY